MKKNIFISIFLIIFIFNIRIVMDSVKYASSLFIEKIFISTFPFMILSDILFYFDYHIFLKDSFVGRFISKIFNIDGSSASVVIFSIFTSQPNNSVYIKNMLDNNLIDIKSANKLLCFTYFPSISFVIGTIGIFMLNSFKLGLFLYLNCLFNNILIGLYLRNEISISYGNKVLEKDTFLNTVKTSIIKSFNNLYIILGNIIIFTIIIDLISFLLNIDNLFIVLISVILEITNGINNIILSDVSLISKLVLISFALNFSGFSILFQSFSILSNYKINIKKILVIKLIFSIISSFLFMLILPILLQN